MTSLDSFPGPSGITSAAEAGKDLAGLIARSSAGVPRAGIFPRSTSAALITARTDFRVDIGEFSSALVRSSGVRLSGNDGAVTVPAIGQTALAAPASNTRYTVFYQRQNETTEGDADNVSTIGYVTGTANADLPTALASARALLPASALELGHVAIPSTATATNSAGVVITTTAPYTATAGGAVYLRNATEEAAWAPADGALAWRIDTGRPLMRLGGAWRPLGFEPLLNEWHVNVPAGSAGGRPLAPGGGSTLVVAAKPYVRNLRLTVQGGVFLSANGDGGVSATPSVGSWVGATNSHRVNGIANVFSDVSYVFYMSALAANTATTLTLVSASSVSAGYDLHFTLEEV